MAVPLEQFLQQLEESGILDGDTLREFLPPQATPQDGADLARELVRKKKLTKYQAEEVYRGNGKSLSLGNYVLIQSIGVGGMGQVFKARHRRMGRMVAVKLLPKELTNDEAAIARFKREVQAAARLTHPNIVEAFDADCAEGVHFLVMELVEGSDLSALVKKNGPFSLGQALNFTLQAARGLAAAHAVGIVHRDIKPANLLLDKEGTVKILDMGLARLSDDGDDKQADLTSTGTIMGTVDYMSPEQALDTKTADSRADIYALGCTLHFLLTGRPAYAGDSMMKKLLAHRDQPIPDLCTQNPDVSASLQAVFARMIAKNVEDRYQTMNEVLAALERGRTGEPDVPAQPPVLSQDSSPDTLSNFLKDSQVRVSPLHAKVTAKPQAGGKQQQLLLFGGGGIAALAVLIVLGLFMFPKSEKRRRPKSSSPVAVKADEAPAETNAGRPADVVPQPSQSALRFDTRQRVLSVEDVPYRPTTLVTVEAWLTPESTEGEGGVFGVPNGYISMNRGAFEIYTFHGHAASRNPIQPGRRVHIAGVNDGGQRRLYLNGKLVGESDDAGAVDPEAKPGRFFMGGDAFRGTFEAIRISKVSLYDKNFTPPKVLELTEDTFALYRCDEGTGDVLHDASENGYHAKIDGPIWVPLETAR